MRGACARGFTLVEILVVVVIVAVLAVAATIAISGSAERSVSNEAERFQARLAQACEQAELVGREIGLTVAADGYGFSRLDGTQWHAFDRDDVLRERRWPAAVHGALRRDGHALDAAATPTDVPQVVCFSSGELTPFELSLATSDGTVDYRVEGHDDGRIEVARAGVPR